MPRQQDVMPFALGIVTCALVLSVGWRGPDRASVAEQVTASRFVLVGPSGKPRGEWAVGADEEVSLKLFDKTGKAMVRMYANRAHERVGLVMKPEGNLDRMISVEFDRLEGAFNITGPEHTGYVHLRHHAEWGAHLDMNGAKHGSLQLECEENYSSTSRPTLDARKATAPDGPNLYLSVGYGEKSCYLGIRRHTEPILLFRDLDRSQWGGFVLPEDGSACIQRGKD